MVEVNKPLAGKRILVTRASQQAGDLSATLAALGARPIEFPTIRIAPLQDAARLDAAIQRVADYDWVIFTSVNGVAAFWERWLALAMDGSALGGVRVAAIGPATAQALIERGVQPDLVPEEFIAEGVAEGLGEVAGLRILLPRADIARKTLAEILTARGARVDEVAAYRTVLAVQTNRPDIDNVDVVTFTSSSTVRNFMAICQQAGLSLPAQASVACIGPVTAQTAREQGLRVDVVATEYTIAGLVNAIVNWARQLEE